MQHNNKIILGIDISYWSSKVDRYSRMPIAAEENGRYKIIRGLNGATYEANRERNAINLRQKRIGIVDI